MSLPIVERRLVVEFYDKNKTYQTWVPPSDRVTTINGSGFLMLSYQGDRGFARFCGADMGTFNPLSQHTWLDEAKELRDKLVDAELQRIACEKVGTHVEGRAVKNRQALQDFLPKVVTINVPPIQVGNDEVTLAGAGGGY